ncbi:BCCT family transporter [Nocardioides panacisoli]|uniref:BCCT family transporter n=1 Tax=Nocardioides panacisoli TaxID=627624 RepID=UPI001C625F8A|nr:BCCT family transporter [Nocardioides panacisoli]QYJ03029.1 BCCT family transporter [Nocardioides panacisoli]
MADGTPTTQGDERINEGKLGELARGLGLRTDPIIFFVAAGLMVVFLITLLIWPTQIGDAFADGRTWVVTNLGWFFILGVSSWLAFLIWVAISKYGSIRLGGDQERPAYSNISWFTMLFAGGIGTVLMFWGVAEPIFHFETPPRGEAPFSSGAANDAMSIAIYHLGLHTWAIFTLPGLAFGYFIYRYDLPFRVSSVFYPFLGEKIHGPIGRTIDIFAVLGTLFGVAVSIGLGTNQINSGLTRLFDVPNTVLPKVLIIAVLTAVAVTSIVVGLDKGVKVLSNVNIGMAVGLMIFVLVVGPTVFLFREMIETLGLYLRNLVPLALWNDSMAYVDGGAYGEGWGWQGGWTVFYWAWTVTWAPFMGVFLARISKGRTIREFIGGVMVAPSLFTLVWFVIFGWTAMRLDGIGSSPDAAHPITEAVTGEGGGAEFAMFAFFESLLSNDALITFISGFVVVIVAIFFATSSDSASLVVDMLCTGTEDPGPTRQRVFWGVSEGALAMMLIVLAGDEGLDALQQVITVIGLPIFILMFLAMVSLYKGLRTEKFVMVKVPVAGSQEPPREDAAVD